MRRVLAGQLLLILCCLFYLIWWYRGYSPGITVNRAGGINGLLLLITAALGVSGLSLSLMHVPEIAVSKISPEHIVIAVAFLISMVLYVAYYRMEEMKAFYAAMVPLVTEAASMAILVWMLIGNL